MKEKDPRNVFVMQFDFLYMLKCGPGGAGGKPSVCGAGGFGFDSWCILSFGLSVPPRL